MERRRFLALVGAGGFGGCLGSRAPASGNGTAPTTTATTDASSTGTPRPVRNTPHDGTAQSGETGTTPVPGPPLAEMGVPATVCEESVRPDFAIRAVVDPATAPGWEGHGIRDPYRTGPSGGLPGPSVVVGLETVDAARAYPFDVLYHHEIINDSLGAAAGDGDDGVAGPVLITYCSLCRSGMVARRTVDGTATTFDVSGLLWRPPRVRVDNSERQGRTAGFTRSEADVDVRPAGNLVMYDLATRSYWSQLLARAICGPERGTRLDVLPATVTTWNEWRATHPDTDVLLPPPHSGTV